MNGYDDSYLFDEDTYLQPVHLEQDEEGYWAYVEDHGGYDD